MGLVLWFVSVMNPTYMVVTHAISNLMYVAIKEIFLKVKSYEMGYKAFMIFIIEVICVFVCTCFYHYMLYIERINIVICVLVQRANIYKIFQD